MRQSRSALAGRSSVGRLRARDAGSFEGSAVLSSLWWLDRRHLLKELVVVLGTLHAVMNLAMANRAKSYDEGRIVWATVAYSTDMMGFEVRLTVHAQKGRFTAATLTMTVGPCKHVISNVSTSIIDCPSASFTFTCTGCLECPSSQLAEINNINDILIVVQLVDNIFQVSEFENDRFTHVIVAVG